MDDGSKTEQATPHKRQEAREEGRVAVSRDLISGLTLLAALLAGRAAWEASLRRLADASQWTFRVAGNHDLSSEGLQQLAVMWQGTVASVILPVVIASAAVGLAVGLGQTRLMFATKALQPKLNMLNPMEGLKRMVSTRGLVEAAKGVLKVTLVLGMASWAAWSRRDDLGRLCNCSLGAATHQAFDLVFFVAIRCAGLLALIGVADYAYQWWEYERSLRMSRQEIIDEYKRLEGDPNVRARRRSLRRNMLQQGISRDMKQATVVVTNPTHIAVALWYKPGMPAPRIVAKGRFQMAQRIVAIARRQGTPIVQNVPLAQSLYKTAGVGDYVPGALYQAVAEVLATLYRAARQRQERQRRYYA